MKKKIIFLVILIAIFVILFLFCLSRTTFYIIATVEDVNNFAGNAIVTPIKQFPAIWITEGFRIKTDLKLEIGDTVKINIKHPIKKFFKDILNPSIILTVAPMQLPQGIEYSVELITE